MLLFFYLEIQNLYYKQYIDILNSLLENFRHTKYFKVLL